MGCSSVYTTQLRFTLRILVLLPYLSMFGASVLYDGDHNTLKLGGSRKGTQDLLIRTSPLIYFLCRSSTFNHQPSSLIKAVS